MSKKSIERERKSVGVQPREVNPRSTKRQRGLREAAETRELLDCLRLIDVLRAGQNRAEQVLLYEARLAILDRISQLQGLRIPLRRGADVVAAFSLGFDRSVMPSPAQFDALRDANASLAWCGYYLAPTPDRKDTSWLGNRSNLLANGWNPVPIYLPSRPATVVKPNGAGAAEAATEGPQAVELTKAEGFPSGTYIYLDIEAGDAFNDKGSGYVSAWAQEIIDAGFQPGIYCSHKLARQVTKILDDMQPSPNARLWVFKVKTVNDHPLKPDLPQQVASSPTGAAPNATMWQFEQNAVIEDSSTILDGLKIDLNMSDVKDPSH